MLSCLLSFDIGLTYKKYIFHFLSFFFSFGFALQVINPPSKFSQSPEHLNLIGPSWAYRKIRSLMVCQTIHRKCLAHYPIGQHHQQAAVQIAHYLIQIVMVIWMTLLQSVNNAAIAPHSPAFNWRSWKRHSREHIIRMFLPGKFYIFGHCFLKLPMNFQGSLFIVTHRWHIALKLQSIDCNWCSSDRI